jgi:hypothetical protein
MCVLERVSNAAEETQLLLFVGDRAPVLDETDAAAHEHELELRHRAEELFDFVDRSGAGSATTRCACSAALAGTAVNTGP